MLIQRFLTWSAHASAENRAEATSALARAYLYADIDPVQQGEAERALTALLDDSSPLVRRALAEAFAGAVDAPHHIVVALAGDQSAVSASVLARSPILSDAELIDAVAIGDDAAQSAVARRPGLSAIVAETLAVIGGRDSILLLCGNPAIDLGLPWVRRVIERFGSDGAVREVLGRRKDLDPAMRHELVAATAPALVRFVADRSWMTAERARRVAGEARDRATMVIAAASAERGCSGLHRFAAHLRATGHLTPALMLRALLSGQSGLFEAALCELSGKPAAPVAGLVRSPGGLGFAALYRKAGMPPALLPAFRAALAAHERGAPVALAGEVGLRRRMVERVLAACAPIDGVEVEKLKALLRRFETEAARDDVRSSAGFGRTPVADDAAEQLAWLPADLRAAA